MIFRLIGMSALQKTMASRHKALTHRRNVNKSAVVLVDRFIQKNFQQQGALTTPGGWKPLALTTIKARRKGKGKGTPKILIDKGWLRQKWKHFYSHSIGKVTSEARGVKSGVFYGVFHDEGRGVPQRKIIPAQRHVKSDIEKLYQTFIDSTVK